MRKAIDLLKNQRRLMAAAIAAGILIFYVVPLDQVTSAPGNGQGNGQGNPYGPHGRGPPGGVPRGPPIIPPGQGGEPLGKPDEVPRGPPITPPGQEEKQGTNEELNKVPK